ncbi:cytochrome P450 family protein [Nocardia thraciensis]
MPNPLGDSSSRRLHVVDPDPAEGLGSRTPPPASPRETAAFLALTTGPRLPLGPLASMAPSTPRLARAFLKRVAAAHDGAPVRIPTPAGPVVMPCTMDSAAELARAVLDGEPGSLKVAVSADGRRQIRHACPPHAWDWTPARDHVRALAAAEAERLLRQRRFDDRLPWPTVIAGWDRLCRRIVLGDRAAGDALLHRDIRARYQAPLTALGQAEQTLNQRIEPYLRAPEAGTPAAVADAAATAQVSAHMLLTLTRSLDRGARALALRAAAGGSAAAAVAESGRLWPEWSHMVYVVAAPFRWRGFEFSCGDSILVPAAWLLRDGRVFGDPDGYVPDGEDRRRVTTFPAARVCGGTPNCPVEELVSETLTAFLEAITTATDPTLVVPRALAANCLPAQLDTGRIRIEFIARDSLPRDSGVLMFDTGSVEDLVMRGNRPGRYGELAAASAARLRDHAQRLRDCADGVDLADDRFHDVRSALFVQAERCACAAADVEAAARGFGATSRGGL